MVTLQSLKDQTAEHIQNEGFPMDEHDWNTFDKSIEIFMDVLEANGGTLRFAELPSLGKRIVEVKPAGERSMGGTG